MADRNPIIWVPSSYELHSSPLAKFRDWVNHRYQLRLKTYHDIHAWSVHPHTAGDFWMALFDFLDLGVSKAPSAPFEKATKMMFPSLAFYPGATMNFAGSVFQNRDPSATAIIEATEGSLDTVSVTWAELRDQVERLADAMRANGVQKGDRVAAIIATSRLAVALCLATLSIGAIWSAISPDFGAKGILDRITQIDPKLIFTDTSLVYNGKTRDLSDIILQWASVASQGTSLEKIVINSSGTNLTSQLSKAVDLNTLCSTGTGQKLRFEQFPFSHPAFIFYSSGTTGTPKCILHSAGGVLLQIKKDYTLHVGVLPTDILFQYTTTAWIMWAFLITGLSIGTAVVVYTGSPLYPDIKFLIRLLSKLRVTIFGTSAKYLTDVMDSGIRPREMVDLSALRRVTSTGSVLPSDVAQWFYNRGFPPSIHLLSGSGGTDCACSFVNGNALMPVHADEIQGKSLGMAVDVFDPLSTEGESLEMTDEPGELVCTAPFPSQPLTFWGSGGSEKYRNAYFSMFGDKVWVQGDLIRINKDTKGIQMLGRSDGVLNPSGVRFGSAEVYNVVRHFPEVEDSICTGQRRPQDRDETVVLFLKLKPGAQRTFALKDHIKKQINQSLSKRHVPKYVFYVDDIPYSNVGKKLEILVKNIISGRKAESTVVANPESISIYQRFYEIEKAHQAESVGEASKL